jgi:hypothetical protein
MTVFGRSFILFTQMDLFAFNVAMLILGPLGLLFLHYIPSSEPAAPARQSQQPPTFKDRLLSLFRRRPSLKVNLRIRRTSWAESWRWLKFWAIFVSAIIFQVILVAILLSANRYVGVPILTAKVTY